MPMAAITVPAADGAGIMTPVLMPMMLAVMAVAVVFGAVTLTWTTLGAATVAAGAAIAATVTTTDLTAMTAAAAALTATTGVAAARLATGWATLTGLIAWRCAAAAVATGLGITGVTVFVMTDAVTREAATMTRMAAGTLLGATPRPDAVTTPATRIGGEARASAAAADGTKEMIRFFMTGMAMSMATRLSKTATAVAMETRGAPTLAATVWGAAVERVLAALSVGGTAAEELLMSVGVVGRSGVEVAVMTMTVLMVSVLLSMAAVWLSLAKVTASSSSIRPVGQETRPRTRGTPQGAMIDV